MSTIRRYETDETMMYSYKITCDKRTIRYRSNASYFGALDRLAIPRGGTRFSIPSLLPASNQFIIALEKYLNTKLLL